jgi:chromosome segregation ATPase
MNENEKNMQLTPEVQMLISGHIPGTKYLDSRFDQLQLQSDELRRNQELFREQARDLKLDMDRKFSDVDKHFEISRQDMLERFTQVDKRFEQVDKRFEQVDKRLDESRRDMKERFEQVDKRLDKVITSIDNLGNKLDKRDEQHRSFTLRMFLAITISLFGVLGVYFKTFGII